MKTTTILSLFLTLLVPMTSCRAQAPAAPSASAYQAALPLFADDAKTPLGVQQLGSGNFDGGRWGKISYAGKGGERVPALIYLPAAASKSHPVPCLLLLHGLGGNKEMMAPLAQFLAGAGYASLMIDEAGQGERGTGGYPTFAGEKDLTDYLVTNSAATVVDLRRGIDYLQTRPDIAKSHIGLIGFSLGALVGTVLAGVDRRVAAVALVSGGGDLGRILQQQVANNQSLGAHYASLLQGVSQDDLEAQLAPVEPLNFVSHIAPRPLLMQNGRKDIVIDPADAQALYDAAGQPKQIVWFPDAGHIPPPLELYPSLSLFLSKYLPAQP